MHPVLLIDEVLRQIFFFCSEYERSSLVAAARSCKAWKDPALDFVWDRLLSVGPLLRLLPGVSLVDSQYVLTSRPFDSDLNAFDSYARRVKHISHQREIRIHHSVATATSTFFSTNGTVLPNLRTAHISFHRCNTFLMPLNLSPALRRIEVDLGFKKAYSSADNMLCDYLERANPSCVGLQHISLRGLASERLNVAISSMRNLQVISLRLGQSLLPETLNSIMAFPSLLELEIHAGHMDPNKLDDTPRHSNSFASLRKLHIRAKSSFIERILHHIEQDTLHHLHIELDDHSPSSISWNNIFRHICYKAANTIHHLSLEHHFELPETTLPSSSMPSGAPLYLNPNTPSQVTPAVPFETMAELSSLKHLKHFCYDATVPPVIRDHDVEKLLSWWPNLEHFELGSVPQVDEGGASSPLHMTMASLSTFATKSPKLRKLILPLAIDHTAVGGNHSASRSTTQLQSLTIAQLTTSNPSELAAYLHGLFPALQTLDGPCDDSEAWMATRAALFTLVPQDAL